MKKKVSTDNYRINPVHHGYFLPQELVVTGINTQFRWIGNPWVFHTRQEVKQYLEYFKGKLDGVEFVPFVQNNKEDIPFVVEVSKMAQDYNIDLWLGPRFQKTLDFFDSIPASYQAFCLYPDGSIRIAMRDTKRYPELDRMNPEAVRWLLDAYHEIFLRHFEPDLLQGLFFPEDHLGGNASYPLETHNALIPPFYGSLPVYSDYCLEKWREYCSKNKVVNKGKPVKYFPVHKPEMVPAGKGKTAYYPGYNLPNRVSPRTRFVDWSRNTGVWVHWYKFICDTFLENWFIPVSQQMHQIFSSSTRWRGVVYFGSSGWMLPYEKFTDPYAKLSCWWEAAAYGYQFGIDLQQMAQTPEINYFIHEFRGLIADCKDYRHKLFLELLGESRDRYGVLVHNHDFDDMWEPQEEKARWGFIKRYQPRIISMYSIAAFYPPVSSGYYDPKAAKLFWQRLKSYQETKNPFSGKI